MAVCGLGPRLAKPFDGLCSHDGRGLVVGEKTVEADVFVSTLPLSDICALTGFSFPLDYRSVAALYVLLSKPHASKNHWIYFMDGPSVLPNRVCEVKNMCPDSGPEDSTVLCTEITECHAPGLPCNGLREVLF